MGPEPSTNRGRAEGLWVRLQLSSPKEVLVILNITKKKKSNVHKFHHQNEGQGDMPSRPRFDP